jgi:fumarate reductase iron-sulfur subunit
MTPHPGAPEHVTLDVFRYRPEEETEPTFETFRVPYRDEWMVLDALNHIKDELDGTLSYRWACRMGVCGSCGMLVNGEPVLTCATYLESLLPGPIRVEPLRGFPVIRDLVGDLTDFVKKLTAVKPWIVREEEKTTESGEYLQTPAQLAEYKQYSMCINCMLCYSACPIYELEPHFIGPAAIALAQRYNLDSRDEGNRERMEVLSSDEGIWSCTFVGECSAVCPKDVDPAGAIQRYKVEATLDWFRSVLPGGDR